MAVHVVVWHMIDTMVSPVDRSYIVILIVHARSARRFPVPDEPDLLPTAPSSPCKTIRFHPSQRQDANQTDPVL